MKPRPTANPELLKALSLVPRSLLTGGGASFEEIAQATDMGQVRLRRLLRDAVEAGTLSVSYRNGTTILGHARRTPVYCPTPLQPNKK